MSLSLDLVGLPLDLLGAVLIAVAQSRMFYVIDEWLLTLDLAITSRLAEPSAPTMRALGWNKQMECAVPRARRLSTIGWILVAAGFAARIPGALPK